MWPVIRTGDVLLVDTRAASPVPGEVWLVERGPDRVAHRVAFADTWRGEVLRIRCQADTGAWDPWVERNQWVGKVVFLERQGQLHSVERRPIDQLIARMGSETPIGYMAVLLVDFFSRNRRNHHDAAAAAPLRKGGVPRD